ncbi:error-prone DNA polymerase [Phenylobacterium sp.]|uniref:error-prone DNA polymerase n=1 Tax=Phenylobacterium sp. TaxID=1871053 RepID=UPI0019915F67|nr:error-prone DNA polymerase [Phenylobacterium sp.]MBC7166395.1 error-prone DNA polymerase [Phenylobacterium sp.]
MSAPAYAELMAASNFSFLRGASHPWELAVTAEALGIEALGVCDRNSLAGVVRAWTAARDLKLRPLTGARLDFADGTPSLLCYPRDREAYGRLTRLLTLGQRRAKKGGCELAYGDFAEHAEGQVLLAVPPRRLDARFERDLERLAVDFRDQVWLAAARGYEARDLPRLSDLTELSQRYGAPMVAVNDVLYHASERRPLQDVLTCIAEKTTIEAAGWRLAANAERHLKSPAEMARLFARFPEAVERSLEVAGRIGFDLSELSYEYPDEPVPPGRTPIEHLRNLTWEGAARRYRRGVPQKVRDLLNHELALIKKLDYPNYFLTVHDIVRWARGQGILCQGRGSAANSCVCFCLGITAVDPTKPDQDLLFSRFISEERSEPPDIDVDFEHERREEVMQYVFARYGRERAAICATVIHYRPRMAIRQVGKALGLTEDVTAALAGTVWGSYGAGTPDAHVRQAGLDPDNPQIRRATTLAAELIGFPRHLSQHVGGFVLTKRRLDETVPIGNAAMPDRTFIEWDKDDIDELGLMKVDVLALGMLTALRKSLSMLRADHGQHLHDLCDIPQEEPGVYAMLSRADSVGVFQVESRAQMSMLPRLKPQRFYDLVIEVAIVRPGPIQGDMVHPYLRRREGKEAVTYPAPAPEHGPPDELKAVLGKTLGVPLFQEQAMRLAIEAAKFSDAEANGLRRSMATFRNYGNVGEYGVKFVEGMVARGYDPDFARRCFAQIEGFGSYGFPESHAISFALLVYASAWIKWRWPDVFCAALLNSQPMGFYQPAQLVRDAREHGVEVRPPCILASDWDCTLEPAKDGGRLKAVRIGLRQIKGLREDEVKRLVAARAAGADTLPALARQARLSRRTLELLAEADACRSLGLERRAALWLAKGLVGEAKVEDEAPLAARLQPREEQAELPLMSLPHQVAEDYRTTRLSLKAHPCAFFREELDRRRITPARRLGELRDGARVSVGGLVLVRQRPGTAKGVTFLTLEDETGPANLVVWKDVFEANRRTVMSAAFLVAHGRLQKAGEVIHLVCERFEDLTPLLSGLRQDEAEIRVASNVAGRLIRSRDFH